MTSLFVSEANKLKNIQIYLEKNDNLLNHFLKYESNIDLCDFLVKLDKERSCKVDRMRYELKDVWRLLNTKKKILQENNINAVDLNSFKTGMVEIQEKIHDLKSRLLGDIDFLKNQEKNISDVNNIYNQRLTEWEKPIVRKIIPSNYKKFPSSCTKEIKQFMDFVSRSHGHENGWTVEDHQLFLKLRNKHKNIHNLAVNLNKLLPDISIKSIKEHEIWFKKYSDLKKKKDEALEKWRQEKTETITQNETTGFVNHKNVVKNQKDHLFRAEDIHEKIALWKAEKAARRQQEYNYERMKEEKLKRLEADKRMFNVQMKDVVKKWREAKLIKEQKDKIEKEMVEFHEKRMKATEANKMIKQFQSQDDIFIARLRFRKLKEKNQATKRSKSSYIPARDPERILKPTKQWILRTTKDDLMDKVVPLYVPNIKEIPKLRIPDWRKVVEMSTSVY